MLEIDQVKHIGIKGCARAHAHNIINKYNQIYIYIYIFIHILMLHYNIDSIYIDVNHICTTCSVYTYS